MTRILCIFSIFLLGTSAQASEEHGGHHSPYAGEQNRAIKSLSPNDIAELKRGGGWGLAKAAELNGAPGPMHALELRDQLKLSPAQFDAISRTFNDMRAQAITNGERLIALEAALEQHFRDGTITEEILRSGLGGISEARRNLRYTHLAAHLETPRNLTKAQIALYNRLRGYEAATNCDEPTHSGHGPHNHTDCQPH